MNLEDYAFGVARQKKLDESDVRYAMAATLLSRLDKSLLDNEREIQALARRRQQLLKERQELIDTISKPPVRLAA